MSKANQLLKQNVDTLSEDVKTLLAATGEAAGTKISEARNHLVSALERGQDIYGELHKGTLDRAKAADKFIRKNPYAAVGLAIGVGALIGCLWKIRSRASDR